MDAEMRATFDSTIHPSIILAAFIMVTMSMLLQGLTAPMVVRWLGHVDGADQDDPNVADPELIE